MAQQSSRPGGVSFSAQTAGAYTASSSPCASLAPSHHQWLAWSGGTLSLPIASVIRPCVPDVAAGTSTAGPSSLSIPQSCPVRFRTFDGTVAPANFRHAAATSPALTCRTSPPRVRTVSGTSTCGGMPLSADSGHGACASLTVPNSASTPPSSMVTSDIEIKRPDTSSGCGYRDQSLSRQVSPMTMISEAGRQSPRVIPPSHSEVAQQAGRQSPPQVIPTMLTAARAVGRTGSLNVPAGHMTGGSLLAPVAKGTPMTPVKAFSVQAPSVQSSSKGQGSVQAAPAQTFGVLRPTRTSLPSSPQVRPRGLTTTIPPSPQQQRSNYYTALPLRSPSPTFRIAPPAITAQRIRDSRMSASGVRPQLGGLEAPRTGEVVQQAVTDSIQNTEKMAVYPGIYQQHLLDAVVKEVMKDGFYEGDCVKADCKTAMRGVCAGTPQGHSEQLHSEESSPPSRADASTACRSDLECSATHSNGASCGALSGATTATLQEPDGNSLFAADTNSVAAVGEACREDGVSVSDVDKVVAHAVDAFFAWCGAQAVDQDLPPFDKLSGEMANTLRRVSLLVATANQRCEEEVAKELWARAQTSKFSTGKNIHGQQVDVEMAGGWNLDHW